MNRRNSAAHTQLTCVVVLLSCNTLRLNEVSQHTRCTQDVGRVVETVDRSSAGKGYSSAVRVPWYVPAFTRRREVRRTVRPYGKRMCMCRTLYLAGSGGAEAWAQLDARADNSAHAGRPAMPPKLPLYTVDGPARRPRATLAPLAARMLAASYGTCWLSTTRNCALCSALVSPLETHATQPGPTLPWCYPTQVFIGRLAMVGFLATCALEIWGPGHPGPIAQVCGQRLAGRLAFSHLE